MENKSAIIITSIGKRVQLIQHLRKNFRIIGVDSGELNAARYFVDEFYKIPKANDRNYIDVLKKICKKENVKALIPLYEGEFQVLNDFREEFKEQGVIIILSGKKVIDICKNKKITNEYFLNSNINLPKVYLDTEIDKIIKERDDTKFPLFIKPIDGMGSSNAFRINNIKELQFFKDYVRNNIIQHCIQADEYTVDCLVDLEGNPIYIVPRKRLEVRSGEVVKSSTVIDYDIIAATLKVIKELNKSKDENKIATIGPLTVQFFKDEDGKIFLLEINPRFGGGVPLSFEAGADYAKALNMMINNEKILFENKFKEKVMIRYDQAVFI